MSSATITLSHISKPFNVGDVITGSSSGATATVVSYNHGATILSVDNISGIFDISNDSLTTESNGVMATITSIS